MNVREESVTTETRKPEPMVGLEVAARFFSLSVVTLRRMIARKRVRSYRLGIKLLRVRLSELETDLVGMRRVGRPKKGEISA